MSSSDTFAKLFKDPGNRTCADCFSNEITHASVSHGTLVCSKCAKLHRALGPNISYVKSLSEIWISNHLKIMASGGNESIRELFKYYGIPSVASVEFKYSTVGAKYYRELLKSKTGTQLCQMARPDTDQGIYLITDPSAYGTNSLEEDDKKNQGISTMLNSAFQAGKELYGKVKEREEYKKIEDATNKVKVTIKKNAEKGVEIGKNGIIWGANKGADIIKTGGNKVIEEIGTRTKGIRVDTKEIFENIEKNTIGKIKKYGGHNVVEISDDDRPSTPPNY